MFYTSLLAHARLSIAPARATQQQERQVTVTVRAAYASERQHAMSSGTPHRVVQV